MGFFVNAAGGKDDPVVIGQSEKPRCFKNLKDASRPYKCHYFAYKKAWMNSDLMTDILVALNRRLQLKQRKIMLFMDNTPCYPASLQDKFSNINIVFLPKKHNVKANEVDEEDDPFEGEELSGLQELVTAMEVSCTAEEVLGAEVRNSNMLWSL